MNYSLIFISFFILINIIFQDIINFLSWKSNNTSIIQNVEYLIKKNVKIIVIACGTATSQAIDILQQKLIAYFGAFNIYTPKNDIANVKNPDLNIFKIFSFFTFVFKSTNFNTFLKSKTINMIILTSIIDIVDVIIFFVI